LPKVSLIALVKPIEAIKVHPRTGIPLGGPDITIPYGALIEPKSGDRDRQTFAYLGELYGCKREAFLTGTGGAGSAPKPDAAPEEDLEPAAAVAMQREAEPGPEPETGPRLVWEQLRSKEYSVRRTAVPGGWLVALSNSVTFVPDPKHAWDGNSVE
jgi:hypothetical protein